MKAKTFFTAIRIFLLHAYRIAKLMRQARSAIWKHDRDSKIREAHQLIFELSKQMLDLFGIQIEIKGELPTNTSPLIIVSNHVSWLDMFVWGYVFHGVPVTAVSKKENFRIPIFGDVIRLLFVVPVERNGKDPKGDRQSMLDVAVLCGEYGLNLLVAAEGTRTKTGKLQRFKRGGFELARAANMNILPLCMENLYEINNANMGFLNIKPGIVTVHFGDIICTEKFNTAEELRDYTYAAMHCMHPASTIAPV